MKQADRLTPAMYCRAFIRTLDESDRRRRKRKRDTRPDRMGFQLKRSILERAVDEQPSSEEFEGWLMQQVQSAEVPGPVHAMCSQILLEYQVAVEDSSYAEWLADEGPQEDRGNAVRG